MDWIRSFFVLFLLLTLLLFLVSGSTFEKYIRFFSEVILAAAFLSPVLSIVFDSDTFFDLVQYETITNSLSELSQDTAKIKFVQNDFYIGKYESAIAADIRQIAEADGYVVKEVSVRLSEEYVLEEVVVAVSGKHTDAVTIEKVQIKKTDIVQDSDKLREKISEYYQIGEEQILICPA